MGHAYRAVGWNRQKVVYDRLLAASVVLYLLAFVGLGSLLHPEATAETLLIRALGTGALLLLHVILCIGPLCRLDHRFLPLLYNRRHMGVTMFLLALLHGGFSLVQFHALGDLDPLVSLLVSNGRWDSLPHFPFQPLGALALVILFLMAATSHDFWLVNLTAPVWKALHMGVYLAYGLIVMHVSLGVLQAETSPAWTGLLGLGAFTVVLLHLLASGREAPGDMPATGAETEEGFVDVAGIEELTEGRGRTVSLAGDRVALFRFDGKVAAISNACQHQNGPLGEGRIRNGCIVCPWHGYEYRPECGSSPPPFTEKVPVFRVRLSGGRVLVHPVPLPPGTLVEPALIPEEA